MTAVVLPPPSGSPSSSTSSSSTTPLSQRPPFGVPTKYPLSEGLSHLSLTPESIPLQKEKPISHEPVVVVQEANECTKKEAHRVFGGPSLSTRATGGPDGGPLIERFSCLFNDIYCADTNPKGIVSMGVAENFLMADELLDFFAKAFRDNFLSSDLSYGDDLWGSRRLRAALATFYTNFFNPSVPVDSSQLIVGAGCSAILDQLFHVLLDPGEGILLSKPYYSGFDRDLRPRSGAVLVGVPLDDEGAGGEGSVEKRFGKALRESREAGIKVRAMIICNPQNPRAFTYSRETLLEYCRFAEEHDLHLVSDEIYGLSVFDNASCPTALPFTSLLSLDVEKELGISFDRARVHVVHGMSKDFCSNGLRLGVLITQANPLLLRTLAQTSMLMKISSPADVLFTSLLTSPPPPGSNAPSYVSWFLAENKIRLGEAHAFLRSWFEKRGVVVSDVNAGHFIWCNLGARMGWTTAEEEKRGFQKLLDGGVYIAPGSAYHNPSPGWFRVTFSVKRANLLVGLAKMEAILDLLPLA